MNEADIYSKIGKEGFTAITAEFYKLMKEDDLIGPMYPDDDWEGAEERLRDFLLFRFGADPTYTIKRGHPRLRMRHAPYSIGEAERDRWMEIMDEAMRRSDTPQEVQVALHRFFANVADFMRNQ